MTLTVTHPYVSSLSESTGSGVSGGTVGPNEWNASHTLTGTLSTANLQAATTAVFGIVQPDNSTVTISSGVLSASAGGTPGGAPTDVQFASSGSTFSGDSRFTYGGAGTGVTIKLSSSTSTAGISALSIVTSSSSNMASNSSALNIAATWNNSGTTFDAPLFMNIANTASAAGSLLVDWQLAGSSIFSLNSSSNLILGKGGSVASLFIYGTSASNVATGNWSILLGDNGTPNIVVGGGYYGFGPSPGAGAAVQLTQDGTAILAQRTTTTPNTFRVYNTTDQAAGAGNPTNYERAVLDWTTTSNVLTIGTQAGGTGTLRPTLLTGLFTASTTSTGVATFASTICPAVTPTAVYQWMKVNLVDGSTGFIPVWK